MNDYSIITVCCSGGVTCTYIIGHHNRQQGFVVGVEGH